jgi:predicted extracellular nuclease
VAEDTVVTITDVVVTSVLDTGEKGFYAQDAGGGEYAGIYIYTGTISAEDIPAITIGSVVTITGTYLEYYDLSEISVSDAADITLTDTATPVVTSISETPTDWESYEGVLVSLDYTVEFIDAATDAEGECLTYGACELDNGLLLDDELFDYSATTGDTYAALTGLISYSYSAWRIYPRDASDLD